LKRIEVLEKKLILLHILSKIANHLLKKILNVFSNFENG